MIFIIKISVIKNYLVIIFFSTLTNFSKVPPQCNTCIYSSSDILAFYLFIICCNVFCIIFLLLINIHNYGDLFPKNTDRLDLARHCPRWAPENRLSDRLPARCFKSFPARALERSAQLSQPMSAQSPLIG